MHPSFRSRISQQAKPEGLADRSIQMTDPQGRPRPRLFQSIAASTLPSLPTISSICALLTISGGDIAMMSPV